MRLPFCNLKCEWCDTEFNTFKKVSLSELQTAIKSEDCRFAVITGGEPSMNKQTPELIAYLKTYGFEVAMETNGCFPIPEGVDWVTVSPKRQSQDWMKSDPYFVHTEAFRKANEFKYVLDAEFDILQLAKHDTEDGRYYYLSPEFNTMEESLKRIFEVMKNESNWRLSLQTHKWMGIE